jgi:hypothetical protein
MLMCRRFRRASDKAPSTTFCSGTVDSMTAVTKAEEATQTWAAAQKLLMPRLSPTEYLKTAPSLVHRDFALSYVIDFGPDVHFVLQDKVDAWAASPSTRCTTPLSPISRRDPRLGYAAMPVQGSARFYTLSDPARVNRILKAQVVDELAESGLE